DRFAGQDQLARVTVGADGVPAVHPFVAVVVAAVALRGDGEFAQHALGEGRGGGVGLGFPAVGAAERAGRVQAERGRRDSDQDGEGGSAARWGMYCTWAWAWGSSAQQRVAAGQRV